MDISEVEEVGDGVLMVPSISDTKSLGGLKRKWKVNPTLPLYPRPSLLNKHALMHSWSYEHLHIKPDPLLTIGAIQSRRQGLLEHVRVRWCRQKHRRLLRALHQVHPRHRGGLAHEAEAMERGRVLGAADWKSMVYSNRTDHFRGEFMCPCCDSHMSLCIPV